MRQLPSLPENSQWANFLGVNNVVWGLLFYGVAEPMLHYGSPPVGEGMTEQAARMAVPITSARSSAYPVCASATLRVTRTGPVRRVQNLRGAKFCLHLNASAVEERRG